MTDIPPLKSDKQILRCLIVDDETTAVKVIANNISKLEYLTVVDSCSTAIEAQEILRNKEVDLMFLDINMPHLSGLDFLESLDNAPLTILTTAYSEFALEGFRLDVVDYLLKPISFQRFYIAAQKARDLFQTQAILQNNKKQIDSGMYVRHDNSFLRIEWADIMYVEGMQNYLKLHFKNKSLVIHQTMISLEEILPKDFFYRIHRSFLVNISHIHSISGNQIFIHGKYLPISKQKREELLNQVVFQNLISK